MSSASAPANPLEPSTLLKEPPPEPVREEALPPQPPLPEDSATTKAEKYERYGFITETAYDDIGIPASKKLKLDGEFQSDIKGQPLVPDRIKGVAQVKPEFIVHPPGSKQAKALQMVDDDAAEASHKPLDARDAPRSKKPKGKPRGKGGFAQDEIQLCASRATSPEFSPEECRFGNKCKFEHDLRRYLKDGKRADLTTFGGRCPIWEVRGKCDEGWKCRFVGSHMRERETEDGRKELVLTEDESRIRITHQDKSGEGPSDIVNVVGTQQKVELSKRGAKTLKADAYADWMVQRAKELEQNLKSSIIRKDYDADGSNCIVTGVHSLGAEDNGVVVPPDEANGLPADGTETMEENRAQYTEPPFLPSEKRRIYFGPETPTLAPLTTQGNLPFRRLCVDLGAQVTYSEMALSTNLLQGQKSEWALMKAHTSETLPPSFASKGDVVTGYDNSRDLKFGAQIAASKAHPAMKATEVLATLLPHLRLVDLNCGCPIDLIYRAGAGSALLDSHAKLEKMLRGMNAVSGEVPITVKIRMGIKDSKPTAQKLVERLALGDERYEDTTGAGVAAITLHGRSRQQRYTRSADWGYIADCAALIERYNQKADALADTVREADPRTQAAGMDRKIYFLGNGDCYSHVDYSTHLQEARVDSVMVARGALIKPWVFEEIESGQYLDKSASERLTYVEKFTKYGLEAWGSDEIGVGITRRFLLEWLSFAYRYIPVSILEHLPPSLQDRPPAWRGRNELETLLGSDNYKDWIKIR
ncbi:MAG: tRNA-dihydrouridine synthase 3 [Candelina submexicana]|nr:MAG: tRNA-dihydrouridine synthase 3 [Candelina submexicana]